MITTNSFTKNTIPALTPADAGTATVNRAVGDFFIITPVDDGFGNWSGTISLTNLVADGRPFFMKLDLTAVMMLGSITWSGPAFQWLDTGGMEPTLSGNSIYLLEFLCYSTGVVTGKVAGTFGA